MRVAIAITTLLAAVARADDSEPGAGKDVVTLTQDNFDDEVLKTKDLFLVEFYAPWCGHCKNLAPEWAKAATALKGMAKLGAVDATKHGDLGKTYKAQGYPTLKAFAYGDKIPHVEGPDCEDDPEFECGGWDADKCKEKGDEEDNFLTANQACCVCGGGMQKPTPEPNMKDYTGGRTADAIVDWVYAELEASGVNISLAELTETEVLENKCMNKKYCIIAVLPHLYDSQASGRREYLDIVSTVAQSMRTLASFIWVQGGNQEKLEEAFQMSAGYPSVVAINKDRKRFAVHKGAFSVDGISKSIRSMQTGRLSTTAYTELPKISKTEAWDGGDYKVEEEEDY